ncbi:MAG TPA: hypothetical protein PKN33_16380 [Phycisphaerae bacterium]|nr:hypothetical protein [Phycisphaerae bacterium]
MTGALHRITLVVGIAILLAGVAGFILVDGLVWAAIAAAGLTCSVVCGVLLAAQESKQHASWPRWSMASYVVAVFVWSWVVSALAYDLFVPRDWAFLVGLLIACVLIAVPSIKIYGKNSLTDVLDASLVLIAGLLLPQATFDVQWRLSLEWLGIYGYIILPIGVAIVVFAMRETMKQGMSRRAGALLCMIGVAFLAAVLVPSVTH